VYAVVEARTAGGVYRSLDGGDTWEHMNTLNPRPIYFSRLYAERPARETALAKSYNLQRQLRPARETTRLMAERITVLAESAREAGAGAPATPKTFESLYLDVSQAGNQAYNAINAAARVEADIDAYAGPPTAAQLRELDRAWADAQASGAALNHVIEAMPALEKAAGKDGSAPGWKPVSLTP
jgi:hypothetical protein